MRSPLALAAALASTFALLPAQTVQAPFNLLYTMTNIGAIPGLSPNWGAIAFDRNDPNILLCSRWATVGVQNLFAVRVVRDALGHVTGFSGTATPIAQADYIDGGLDYHPSGVLFYTRYPSFPAGNSIGQFKPGSTVPDRVNTILGPNYIGGLAIVPAGLPGEGRLKTLRWPGGGWTDASLTPDGNGTFDVVGETQMAVLTGGPDGFVYVPRMAPFFTGADILVGEFNLGSLATYAVDTNGDPVISTRQVFASGLGSAFVMTVDPVTLDVIHAGWSGSQVHVIKGFGLPCGQCSHYGTGLPGTGGLTPTITWLGCPLAGQTTGVHVGNGLPYGIGLLVVGFTQQSIPIFGGTLLSEASILLAYFSGPVGNYPFPLPVPLGVGPLTLYFQAVGLDPGAVQGLSMSNGIVMPIL
jgi:hypothetical protein